MRHWNSTFKVSLSAAILILCIVLDNPYVSVTVIIASNMLVVSLQKANTYYDGMEARCYDGDLIFLEKDKKVETIQIVATVAFIIILILLWGFTR